MTPPGRPGPLDLAIMILSPVIVLVLTAVFLLGWWAEAVWRWATGTGAREDKWMT